MTANVDNTTRLREAWLSRLAGLMVKVIEQRAGVKLPPYRVTCGFPSRGGELGKDSRVRGQCWAASASDDGHAEVFISPVEAESKVVAEILAHELIHAALPQAGHKKPFQAAAAKVGFTAPFTTATPTPEFDAWCAPLLAKVGAYPHARLVAMRPVAAPKKQTARLLKAICMAGAGDAECGYTVRVTRKWVEVGAPCCPLHGAMEVEGLDEIEDGEGDDGLEAEAA